MKFSVVIPLYNKHSYIQDAILSALSQNFNGDYEIIVVDDGSTDNSLKMAQEIKDKRLKIIAQQNQGVAVARNTGIACSCGEYVAFLDADDKWTPDYLSTIAALTRKYPQSDIFVTAYRVRMKDGNIHHSRQLSRQSGCLKSYWCTLTSKYDFVWTSATTVRKEALVNAGLFKKGEMIGQDLDMWARVAHNNPRVAYSGTECVEYNRSAEQNARTRVKIAWPAAFLNDLLREMKNPVLSDKEKKAIQYKYDMKMTAYVFTSIMVGEKSRAKKTIASWGGKPDARRSLLRFILRIATLMPTWFLEKLYQFRLKAF